MMIGVLGSSSKTSSVLHENLHRNNKVRNGTTKCQVRRKGLTQSTGINSILIPASKVDPPPNPSFVNRSAPNNLSIIPRRRRSGLVLTSTHQGRERTHGKKEAIVDLKRSFPAKRLAACFG